MCVCVRERERERKRDCVRVRVCKRERDRNMLRFSPASILLLNLGIKNGVLDFYDRELP